MKPLLPWPNLSITQSGFYSPNPSKVCLSVVSFPYTFWASLQAFGWLLTPLEGRYSQHRDQPFFNHLFGFWQSDIWQSDFWQSDFWLSDFWQSDFWQSDFWQSDFWQSDFWQSDFRQSVLTADGKIFIAFFIKTFYHENLICCVLLKPVFLRT